jgi:hypothetical protein
MNEPFLDFTGAQLRSALRHSTEIAHLGTRLAYEWPNHPAREYFQERLAYARAAAMARDEDAPIDHHVAYARCFDAKPDGARFWLDAGMAMRFEAAYTEVTAAIRSAAPFRKARPLYGALRAQSNKTPAPIRAMERARETRAKGFTQEEASIEAQRVLAMEGMFPGEPLPVMIEIPRLRADGDWMIGALARFREGLETAIDVLDAARAFLAQAEIVLGRPTAKPKAAWRALPVLAGLPTLRSQDLAARLQISQKAAIDALEELTAAGLAREIRGLKSWKVWTANDPILGLPAPPDHQRYFLPLPGGSHAVITAKDVA